MSRFSDKKFVKLRKQLDQLGYRLAFGIESMPLVEQLFSDLIHTTESLKKAKLASRNNPSPSKSKAEINDVIEPYSAENARLVQENNKLHLQVIELKDGLDKSTKEYKHELTKLKHENSDLRFLNNQFVHKVRNLESENTEKIETIQKLQEKNLQAVIQTPGGRKRTIPFRRQHMQIECTLPERKAVPLSYQTDDPYIVDLIQVADDKIESLSKELKILDEVNTIDQSKIQSLQSQVESRDVEIQRLHRQLDGGRPHDVLSLEAKNRSNERLINHLNLQLEYLQETNQDHAAETEELRRLKVEATVLADRYKEETLTLRTEIKDIQSLAQDLEDEKKMIAQTADRDMKDAQKELLLKDRNETIIEDKLVDMQVSFKELEDVNEDLKFRLETAERDIEKLTDNLSRHQANERMLNKRINDLNSKERELVLELEEYRLSPMKARRSKSPSRLDKFLKTLEQERDYYKNECNVLNTVLQEKENKQSKSNRSRCSTPEVTLQEKSTNNSVGVTEAKYRRVVRERDELQALMDKFQVHMSEIQANVKVLTQERDKTNNLYEQTHKELQRARHEIMNNSSSPKASLTARSLLQRVEEERDNAVSDLRRMTTECDNLRQRVELQQQQGSVDLDKLSEQLNDAKQKNYALSREKMDMQTQIDSLSDIKLAQDDDLKVSRAKLNNLEDEVDELRKELDDIKVLKAQAEKSLESIQRHFAKKSSELEMAQSRIQALEGKISDILDSAGKQADDSMNLRVTVTSLDREKDALQSALDDKTVRISFLEEDVRKCNLEAMEQKKFISSLENKLDNASEELSRCEREIRSLQRQLEANHNELSGAILTKERLLQENKQQREDLATMTHENQDLNVELEDIMKERDEARIKTKELITRVANLDGELASKEREFSDVMDQYRKVSNQRDSSACSIRVAEEEMQTLKLQLMSANNEITHQQNKISDLEQELSRHLQGQQLYENKISELTALLERLERDLQLSNSERQILTTDLSAARDLNAKLDLMKEQMQMQLASKNVEFEQLKASFDDSNEQLGILMTQLDDCSSSNKQLEDIIANAREKEFNANQEIQTLKVSEDVGKDKVMLKEREINRISQEVLTLREQVSELTGQLDAAKSRLTNESYERERAVQELRKHGLPSPSSASRTYQTSRLSARSTSPDGKTHSSI